MTYSNFPFFNKKIIEIEAIHTNIIADLLSVTGQHNSKNIFQKNFINYLNINNNYDYLCESEVQCSRVGKIRADIALWNKDFNIYIEIKVNSKAHHKQLFWYYIDSVMCNKKCSIVYLTPSGKPPEETACYISKLQEPNQFKDIHKDINFYEDLEYIKTEDDERYYIKKSMVKCLSFKNFCEIILCHHEDEEIQKYIDAINLYF